MHELADSLEGFVFEDEIREGNHHAVFRLSREGQVFILKATKCGDQEADNLEREIRCYESSILNQVQPDLDDYGTAKGYVYHVTEHCGDTPRGPWTAAQAHRYAETLAEVLGNIHGEKSVQWADVEGWKRSVTSLSEECQDEVLDTDKKKYVSSVTSWLQAVETNTRVSHGDVKLGNTIVGRGGSLTNMVDWEHVKLRSKYFDLAKAELRILRSHFKHGEGIDGCIDRFRRAYPEQLDERILTILELLKAFRIRGRLERMGPYKDWVKRRSESISDVYDDIIAHLKRVTPIIE